MRLRIFISSVQKEFGEQRADLKAFLTNDAALRRFIDDVFLFEELPAKDQRANQAYLTKLDTCDIYLGLLGDDYGFEDTEGVSPTEREFDRATELGIPRFVYIWGADDTNRHTKMKKLIRKVGSQVIRRRVDDFNALTAEIYASLIDYLDEQGQLRVPPFDAAPCTKATLKDISSDRIRWFLQTARAERGFPLKENSSSKTLLTHLNLLDDGTLPNAAILLFGSNPQRYHRVAETKCVSCHGIEYRRPFAAQQVYGGDLFNQAEQAKEFVLSRIDRAVGTRAKSLQAPVTYELPPDAVGEAIVNAIAHRDYNSKASVELRLFSDRLEIWNPGRLPENLTPELLREDHPSIPANPLIAESLYLGRYIERAGSGTQAMIALCLEIGLPEPSFEQRGGSFVQTIWRDWLTGPVMDELDLNERQKAGLAYLKTNGKLTNREYQETSGTIARTASRDLKRLVEIGLIRREGSTGRSAHYVLGRKQDINRT